MTAAIPLKPLIIPDSADLVAGGASESLMHLLNDIKNRLDLIGAYQEPVIPDPPDPVVLKIGYVEDNTPRTTTAVIPNDGSKPQIGEGTQFLLLPFTPLATDSKIIIEATGFIAPSSNVAMFAAFLGTDPDAIVAGLTATTASLCLRVQVDSWGTTAKDISLRYGNSLGSVTSVGQYSVTLGNTMIYSLRVTEYKNPA